MRDKTYRERICIWTKGRLYRGHYISRRYTLGLQLYNYAGHLHVSRLAYFSLEIYVLIVDSDDLLNSTSSRTKAIYILNPMIEIEM